MEIDVDIWFEGVDDVIETHRLSDYGGTVPSAGDLVTVSLNGNNSDSFVATQRLASSHHKSWSLWVKPTSKRGEDFLDYKLEEG